MRNTIPDEELVESTLGGDEHAFSELYERYRRPVYSTAYRITQNAADAQDATQEIFVKLFRSLRSWNPRRAKFSTWLFRMAANQAIDSWRQRRRRAEDQIPAGGSGRALLDKTLREAIRSPYRDVESRDSLGEVRRSIDALPELQKKVFILRFFQELKLGEIAEIEGCSLGTVKTSLFRATQTVRRALRASKKAL
jgi:RNA polymerase sigma-70 factor (ECF subfamily)